MLFQNTQVKNGTYLQYNEVINVGTQFHTIREEFIAASLIPQIKRNTEQNK